MKVQYKVSYAENSIPCFRVCIPNHHEYRSSCRLKTKTDQILVSPGDLAKVEIPPGRILFEEERSIEIFLYLEILSPGWTGGTGGRILRFERNEAQKKKGLEIVLEMWMMMMKVMEVATLYLDVELEELEVEVAVELFSSVPESWE